MRLEMCFSFQWWIAQHDLLATVRLYQNWIGFNLADRQKRSVLADPILWYNGYLGGFRVHIRWYSSP